MNYLTYLGHRGRFLLLALLLVSVSTSTTAKELTVAVFENKPIVYTDEGQAAGLFVEVLNSAAVANGWTVNYQSCAIRDCIQKVESGELDLLPSLGKTPARLESLSFSSEVVWNFWGTLYSTNSSILVIDDLAGKRLAVRTGNKTTAAIKALIEEAAIEVELVSFLNYEEAFASMLDGSVDVVAANNSYALSLLDSQVPIFRSPVVFNPFPAFFATQKGSDNEAILKEIDFHVSLLRQSADSIYYQFIRDWYPESDRISLGFVLFLIAGVAVVVGLVSWLIYTFKLHHLSKELEANLYKLNLAVDSGHIGIWIYDTKTGLLNWDETMYALYGLEKSNTEEHYQLWRSAVLPEDLERAEYELGQAVETGSDFSSEFRIVLPSGEIRWIEAKAKLTDEKVFIGLNKDITDYIFLLRKTEEMVERVKIESEEKDFAMRQIDVHRQELAAQNEELQENIVMNRELTEKFTVLFNSSPTAYALLNTEGMIKEFNPQFSLMTERGLATLSGKPISVYLNIDMHTLDELGYNFHDSDHWIRSDLKVSSTKTVPVRYGLSKVMIDGRQYYLLGMIDIAHELRSEALFKSAIETKARFVANMSHEIRTPLHGVIGNLSLIKRRAQLGAEDLENLDMAVLSGEHLGRIIDDILDLSRLDAGSFTLREEPVDVKTQLESWIKQLQPLATKKGLELICSIISDDSLAAVIDADRFHQILNNLVGNAIKFTQQGRVTVQLEWHPEGDSGQLSLTVQDTGIGISDADIKRIMDPFTQVDNPLVREAGGTGLGLSIVEKLTTLMKGELSVTSKLGKGTRFTLRFTPKAALLEEDEELNSTLLEHANEQSIEGMRVLLVDDSQMNRMLGKQMCSDINVTAVMAEDGQEAIDLLFNDKRGFDLILMDIQMPVMDGITASKRIRSDARFDQLPIIAVTANIQPSDRESYLRAGMQDVLAKPFKLDALVKVLKKFRL